MNKERNHDRAREQLQDAGKSQEKDLRNATAELAKTFQARLDKISDKAREGIQAQLQAVGADRSPLAERAGAKLDAMRAEFAARLREVAGTGADAMSAVHQQAVKDSEQVKEALAAEIGQYRDKRADVSVDQDRAATQRTRVADALERNEKQLSAIQTVRDAMEKERNAPDVGAQSRAELGRDVANLDARIDVYRKRAEAIDQLNNVLERGRVDMAARMLDALKAADSGRRQGQTADEKVRDAKRVDDLREDQGSQRASDERSKYQILDRKFSEIPSVKALWNEAADAAKKKDPSVEGRELYTRTMDEFKKRLVDESNPQAAQARALFEKDGFRFSRDEHQALEKKLPLLHDAQLEAKTDMARHADLFRISGQHLSKLKDGGNAVDPDNLSFMIARDNMHMDVRNVLSEYVRQKLVEELKKKGIDDQAAKDNAQDDI